MTMACVDPAPGDGSSFQCSGEAVLRVDHGVGITRSGVQVYGRSTIDGGTVANGLAPGSMAAGATAEMRIARNFATGSASRPALLLDRLGISWDGTTERPRIIDTFSPVGETRVELAGNGAVTTIALPPSSNLAFYDYASRGLGATQAHYANNVYFPRGPENPPRCPANIDPGRCTVESTGIRSQPAGNWRNGGLEPDSASAGRLHGDGDVHAGDAASGNPPILPGGSGIGAPFPGSKGYRTLEHLGYRYANLAAWFTQDTVQIVEWTGGPGANEHNQNRRGLLAFGDVTDPAAVPTAGTATYSGIAYAWHAPGATTDPTTYRGSVTVTVDFATRRSVIDLQGIGPATFAATVPAGAPGAASANVIAGPVTAGNALSGGLAARYFGAVAGGAGGTGPAEVGGTFTLTAAGSGATVIGGFIAMKR
jgi:hypothetical protein